ncbi:MAG: Ig-like domain-containing protein [Eubacteriales bacterium]|nr:Ig-like domain-containing protein [Eubacteriales bacterium]
MKYIKGTISVLLLIMTVINLCGCLVTAPPVKEMTGEDEAKVMNFYKEESPTEITVGEYEFMKVNIKTDCEPYVIWSSSNPEIATVDSNGRVDGIKAGEVTITATAKSASVDFEVTVKKAKTKVISESTATVGNKNALEIAKKNAIVDSGKPTYALLINMGECLITVYTYDSAGVYNRAVRQFACAVDKGSNVLLEYEYFLGDKDRWYEAKDGRFYQFSTWFSDDFRISSAPYRKEASGSLVAEDYNKIGTPATKGDVWVSANDAMWIYENCGRDTMVEFFSKSYIPLDKPKPLTLTEDSLNMNWDPTDPSEKNPYKVKFPTFTGVEDTTVKYGSVFDALDGVEVYDTCGKKRTTGIKVEGEVLCKKAGKYVISYYYEDEMHRLSRADRVVTVEI